MPKTLGQEILFTIMMVLVMVYAMICYNIALATGGLSNSVFLLAFHELPIMMPIAFVLDIFIVGPIAKKITFSKFNPEQTNPVFIVLSISICSVWLMCPLMSLAATILFKDAGSEFVSVWLQTTAMNFPMALCWQIFFAGPLVRNVFGFIMKTFFKGSVNKAQKAA